MRKVLVNGTSALENIKRGTDADRPVALEFAKKRVKLDASDPIQLIRRSATGLPAPFDKLLGELSDRTWAVVLQAAKADLQSIWQRDVAGVLARDFAARYPFDRKSKNDVSVEEFQNFFGNEGILATFIRDDLGGLVDQNSGRPLVIDGQSMSFSPEFLASISQIHKVRDTFFASGGVPTFRYTVEPLAMSATLARSVLNIEGQLVAYSHGPQRTVNILWPNTTSGQQNASSVRVAGTGHNAGTTSMLSFDGAWSSFRLFDHATKVKQYDDHIDLVLSTVPGEVHYRLRMTGMATNPFAAQVLSSAMLPSEL
jgi:type VI secretion system protein ImpL